MRSAALISLSLLLLGFPAVAADCFGCLSAPCSHGGGAPVQDRAAAAEADLPPCHAAMAEATLAESSTTSPPEAPSPRPCHDDGSALMSCCDGAAAAPAATILPGAEQAASESRLARHSALQPEASTQPASALAPRARPPSAIYLLNAAWLI